MKIQYFQEKAPKTKNLQQILTLLLSYFISMASVGQKKTQKQKNLPYIHPSLLSSGCLEPWAKTENVKVNEGQIQQIIFSRAVQLVLHQMNLVHCVGHSPFTLSFSFTFSKNRSSYRKAPCSLGRGPTNLNLFTALMCSPCRSTEQVFPTDSINLIRSYRKPNRREWYVLMCILRFSFTEY